MANLGRQGPRRAPARVGVPAAVGNLDLGSILVISHVCHSTMPVRTRHGVLNPVGMLRRMLIGACDPMLRPIHVSNWTAMGGCYGWLLWMVAMGGC